MSGIKIPIRADISQLKSDLQEITKEAERINQSLGNNRVNFDVDKARDQLNRLWELANKLESSISKTHKFTVDAADAAAELTRAREAAEKLAEALSTAGTGNVNPAYRRATEEARQLESAIGRVVHQQRQLSDLLRREVVGAGGSIVGSIMPGFGSVAGTAGRFAAGGSGIAGMIGRFALGAGVGAAVYGAIKTAQHVPAAEQEAIATSDLRRTIGALTGDFEALRDAARNAVYFGNLGVTSTEFLGYERQYARIAGTRGIDALENETSGAIEFARQFGLDPSEGVSFFGASRRFRATGSDEQSQRRFANLIGEAVARVGFAQSSEVLQAIAQFMGSSARSIIGPAAGTDEYTRMLANLTGPGSAYGQDVSGAASLLSRMDAGFKSGFAGAGPGGQAFSLGVLQSLSKALNATDVKGIMEAGMDATLRDAIGESSVMYQANVSERARYRQALKDAGPKADMPMSLIYLRAIEKSVPPALRTNAVANVFGVGEREAAAYRAYAAQAGSPEEFKKLIKESGLDKTQQDEGEKIRNSIAAVETAIIHFSEKLLPINQSIRDGILMAFGKTPDQLRDWQLGITGARERIDDRALEIHSLRDIKLPITSTLAKHGIMQGTYEEQRRRLKELEDADAADRAIIKSAEETALLNSPSKYDNLFKKSAEKYGLDWRLIKAVAVHESRLKASATNRNKNGSIDYGIMQLNDHGAGAGMSRADLLDPEKNIDAGARYIHEITKNGGVTPETLSRYNGTGAAAERYGKEVYDLYNSSRIHDPLPPEHKAKTGADKLSSININGQFTLRDSRGNEIADPIAISHRYSLPHAGLA